MSESKFEIGDGYKTRDGRDAGIWDIDEHYIHGWTMVAEKKMSRQWFLSGRCLTGLSDEKDIMPKPIQFYAVYDPSGGMCIVSGLEITELSRRFPISKIVLMREVRE